jgi:rod shape-determining protein MreD
VKLYLSALILLALALIQVTQGERAMIAGGIPGLVLIAVVSWGVARGGLEALKWGILGGIWLDLFSGFPVGSHVFALVVVAFLVGLGERTVFQGNFVFPLLTVFIATFVYDGTLLLLAGATGRQVAFDQAFQATIFPSAVYNAALFPLAHAVLLRLDRRFALPVQPEW